MMSYSTASGAVMFVPETIERKKGASVKSSKILPDQGAALLEQTLSYKSFDPQVHVPYQPEDEVGLADVAGA